MRNASPYRIDMQHHKQWARKWRYPLTALVAVLFILGTAPVVGDSLTASILTLPETKELIQSNPVEARKVLLDETFRFAKECKRLALNECSKRGGELADILADDTKQLETTVKLLETFFGEFEPQLSRRLCIYDVGNLTAELKKQSAILGKFTHENEGAFEDSQLAEKAQELENLAADLQAFVEACK